MKLKKTAEMDAHVSNSDTFRHPSMYHLRGRSKIVELIVVEDVILALNFNGSCVAFLRSTKEKIGVVNGSSESVVRSLFHNKSRRSVVLVSVSRDDDYSSLKCYSLKIDHLRARKFDKMELLFRGEVLKWPGFVEFDDVNGMILTYASLQKRYKLWSLETYEFVFVLTNPNIEEIKLSPSIMLVIYTLHRTASRVLPLEIRNVRTGKLLSTLKYVLKEGEGDIDFIEQFDEKLLVKQQHGPLRILDVLGTSPTIFVNGNEFLAPKAFIYLYENRTFLTFRGCKMQAWNFRGQRAMTFEDHRLADCDSNTNCIYISSAQDIIISYCESKRARVGSAASIHVTDLASGRCVARIDPREDKPAITYALTDVTVLYYCEESGEIFTGNSQGFIHTWAC